MTLEMSQAHQSKWLDTSTETYSYVDRYFKSTGKQQLRIGPEMPHLVFQANALHEENKPRVNRNYVNNVRTS